MSDRYAAGPKDVLLLTKLADKQYDRSKFEKAVEIWKEIISLDPEGKQGMTEYKKKPVTCAEMAEFKLGRAICYGQGFPRREGGPLEKFIEKYPASPMKKEAYSALVIHYSPGRVSKEATEKFFAKVFAEYPDDPWFRFDYAQAAVYEENADLDKAIEAIEQISAFPTSYYVNTKAELYAKKGDLSRAEAAYGSEYADSLVSSTVGNLVQYGAFWIEQKTNLEDAEKKILLAIQMDPAGYYGRMVLAQYYMQGKNEAKALEIFGPEYLKGAKAEAMDLTQYAGFWIRNKQNMESALEALETSLKKALGSPDTLSSYAIQNAARYFALAGKPERLMDFYGPEYIKTQWDVPTTLSNYARFWAERKSNLESALAASDRALSLKEAQVLNMPFHWSARAAVFQAMGRLEEAKAAMEKAVEFSANSGLNVEYYKTQLKKIQDEIDKKKK